MLAFLLGILLLAIAFTGFLDVGLYGANPFSAFLERMSAGPFRAYRTWGNEHRGWAALLGWMGLLLALGGAVFAFGYNHLLAPLVSWIKTGKTR